MSEASRPVPDPRRDGKGRFGAGNNANPTGKKGPRSLTGILREILAEQLDPKQGDDGPTRADAFVHSMINNAEGGNATLAKEIWERLEGKVPDRVEADFGPNWETSFDAHGDESDGDDTREALQ